MTRKKKMCRGADAITFQFSAANFALRSQSRPNYGFVIMIPLLFFTNSSAALQRTEEEARLINK